MAMAAVISLALATALPALDVFAPADLRNRPEPDRDPLHPWIWLDGYGHMPRNKLALDDDRLLLHPFLVLEVGVDSNPRHNSADRPASDSVRAMVGSEVRWQWTDTTAVLGRAETEGSANLALGDTFGRAIGKVEIDHRGQTVESGAGVEGGAVDQDLEGGSRRSREDYLAAFAGGRLVGATTALGARLDGVIHDHRDEAGDDIESERRDRRSLSLSLDAATRTHANLELRGELRLGVTRYVDEELFQSHEDAAVVGGGTWDWGSRSWLDFELGIEGRRHSDDFGHREDWNDRRVASPIWAGDLRWGWRPLVYAGIETFGRLIDSDISNDRLECSVRFYHHRALLGERLALLSWLSWTSYREAGGAPPEVRDNFQFDLKFPYDLGDGLQLRPELRLLHSQARLGADFNQARLLVALVAVW